MIPQRSRQGGRWGSDWDSGTWLEGLKFAAILFFSQKALAHFRIVELSLPPADADHASAAQAKDGAISQPYFDAGGFGVLWGGPTAGAKGTAIIATKQGHQVCAGIAVLLATRQKGPTDLHPPEVVAHAGSSCSLSSSEASEGRPQVSEILGQSDR